MSAIPETAPSLAAPVDGAYVIDHPSGFLALSRRNSRFEAERGDGFIAYREQGRHLVALGGVHAPPATRGALLDRFLAYAEARRRRPLFVQVREAQVALFRARGFATSSAPASA